MDTSVLILYCGYSLLQLYLFFAPMFLTLITKGHVQLPCVLLTYLHQWSFKACPYFLTLQDASVQFSWVQLLSRVPLFATPWIAARQVSLSITNSRSSLKLTSLESVMPSSHLILCHPLFLPPPTPPSITVFSNESALRLRWPKYWSFSFSISPSPSPGACSNSCPLSQWRHPAISPSVIFVFSCPQSFPASGSFPMSRLFTSGGQSIGASASASVPPMNI